MDRSFGAVTVTAVKPTDHEHSGEAVRQTTRPCDTARAEQPRPRNKPPGQTGNYRPPQLSGGSQTPSPARTGHKPRSLAHTSHKLPFQLRRVTNPALQSSDPLRRTDTASAAHGASAARGAPAAHPGPEPPQLGSSVPGAASSCEQSSSSSTVRATLTNCPHGRRPRYLRLGVERAPSDRHRTANVAHNG